VRACFCQAPKVWTTRVHRGKAGRRRSGVGGDAAGVSKNHRSPRSAISIGGPSRGIANYLELPLRRRRSTYPKNPRPPGARAPGWRERVGVGDLGGFVGRTKGRFIRVIAAFIRRHGQALQ